MNLKVVGKSGQITIGKAMAGMGFIMETLPDGNILLRHTVIPAGERWLHEPVMKKKLALADEWMSNNSAKESNPDEFESKLASIV